MAFCESCGREIPDDTKFCGYCGAPVGEEPADTAEKEVGKTEEKAAEKKSGKKAGKTENEELIKGQKVTENIYLCPDGKYRWIYEFEMLKNPSILITVWKVLALSFGIVMAFTLLVTLISGDFKYWNAEDAFGFFRGFLLLLVFMMALGVVAYFIIAAIYGWKYMVLFTMDKDGVEHRQMVKQFEKAQAIGWLTAAAGALSGNIGRVGTGILTATRTSSISVFANVRTVRSVRRRHTVYVNQLLFRNQVYANDEDFDFVRDFIIRHCTNAKHVS